MSIEMRLRKLESAKPVTSRPAQMSAEQWFRENGEAFEAEWRKLYESYTEAELQEIFRPIEEYLAACEAREHGGRT